MRRQAFVADPISQATVSIEHCFAETVEREAAAALPSFQAGDSALLAIYHRGQSQLAVSESLVTPAQFQ